MQTPVGPSLRIMLGAAGVAADIAETALKEVWERWLGPQRFARKLHQLEKAGLIEQRHDEPNLERVIRLTEAGRQAAAGGIDPAARWQRPWDGRWRMVLFDVPERHRQARIRMRQQLRRLRFGYLQDSVWITPDAAETLLSALREIVPDAVTLTLVDARPCSGETDQDFVAGAWDFARINRGYDDYLKILRALPAKGSGSARKNWIETEWRAWTRAAGPTHSCPRPCYRAGIADGTHGRLATRRSGPRGSGGSSGKISAGRLRCRGASRQEHA